MVSVFAMTTTAFARVAGARRFGRGALVSRVGGVSVRICRLVLGLLVGSSILLGPRRGGVDLSVGCIALELGRVRVLRLRRVNICIRDITSSCRTRRRRACRISVGCSCCACSQSSLDSCQLALLK